MSHLKIYFKNGINGTRVDWSQYLSTMGKIKKKVESNKAGEAGVIVFDKVNIVLEYKAGTPVYNAFNTDLNSIQRYIIEIEGLKTNKSSVQEFSGIIDFASLSWPDGEKKIGFDVLDKLSAIDVIANISTQRQNVNVASRLGISGSYGIGISKVNLQGVGECYALPTSTITYVNYTATPDQPIPHPTLLLEKGDTFLHPNIGAYGPEGVIDAGLKEKFLVIDSGFTNYNGVATTWIKVLGTPPSNFEYNPGTYEYFIPHISIWSKAYYNESDICCYGYDSYNRYVVTGFDALLIIQAIYNQVWGTSTFINRSGSTQFPIPLSYFIKLIDENPFGLHPLDALKMLTDSMLCYIYINHTDELVIQKKTDLGTNGTTRTLNNQLLKKGGNRKYMWDKLVDEVEITVNSWVKNGAGEYLQGSSSLKKSPNIKSRNPFKKEVLALSNSANDLAALNDCASTVSYEYFQFYGNRHWGYNLSLRMNDSMFDWELLDNITIDGQQYFFVSLSLDLIRRSLDAELVSVQSYNYDFTQAHIALNDSNTSNYYSSSTGSESSGGTAVLNPLLASLSQIDSTRGVLVQVGDTLFAKRKITGTLNGIKIVDANDETNESGTSNDFVIKLHDDVKVVNSVTINGAVDSSYKLKVYGDSNLTGNLKIDGVFAIGGAIDANYKQKIYGSQKITGDIVVDGNIYIGGFINQVNVQDLNIVDHAIRLNKSGDNTTALDGGIEMLGSGDALLGSLKYNGSSWINDLNYDVVSGKSYKISGADVLTSNTLGASVVNSSLTSIGILNHDLNIANTKAYQINGVQVLSSNSLGSNIVSSSLTSVGTLNHDLNIANTKVYKINGAQVLSSSALGSGVTGSALTSVGTLTSGVWNATAIADQYIASAATWNNKEVPLTFSYPLLRTSNTITLSYNSTNLRLSSNALNTIQDIASTSSPAFASVTLSGRLDQQGTANSEFASQSLLPKQSYYGNLGALNKKWLTLHAAELWVETLVAQNTIATIGGRILVGPTTSLTQDLTSGTNTIHVKHNEMNTGDVVYMEANGSIEFMYISGGPYSESGGYYYNCWRDLDETGANNWNAGDAVFNTGTPGEGFIDLYSVRGIKSSSQTGPTIVGNVRNSITYNDWSEHWAIGNLNNLYGFTSNTYGVGLGRYANNSSFVTVDSTYGIRLRYKNSGGVITDKITMDMSGNVSIAGYLQVGNAASDINNGSTTVSGGKITAYSITLSQLSFTPVQGTNVIASINSSAEGITINANKLTLTGVLQVGGAATDVNNGATTISGGKITANSITADRLNVTSLSAINANLGNVTAGTLTGVTITGGTFRTAASNQRIVIDSTNNLTFYYTNSISAAFHTSGNSNSFGAEIQLDGNFVTTGDVIGTNVVATLGFMNSVYGYRVNGSAASGSFLRGNGTNFVSSTIQVSDLPAHTHNYNANLGITNIGSGLNISSGYLNNTSPFPGFGTNHSTAAYGDHSGFNLNDAESITITAYHNSIGYFPITSGKNCIKITPDAANYSVTVYNLMDKTPIWIVNLGSYPIKIIGVILQPGRSMLVMYDSATSNIWHICERNNCEWLGFGTTAQRPSATFHPDGGMFWDTTIGKLVMIVNSAWQTEY
jgi:hypothetical protein